MKKKIICILIAIFLCLSIGVNYVQAYDTSSIEIDPDNLMTLPPMIFSEIAKATISPNAGSGYKFYYQTVYLTDAQYSAIRQKNNDAEKEQANMQEQLNELQETAETVENKYEEEYQKNPSSQETTDAREAYNTAVKEYNEYVKTYNAKIKAYQDEIAASIPSFVESKWTQANDGTMNFDFSERTRTSTFCIMDKINSE